MRVGVIGFLYRRLVCGKLVSPRVTPPVRASNRKLEPSSVSTGCFAERNKGSSVCFTGAPSCLANLLAACTPGASCSPIFFLLKSSRYTSPARSCPLVFSSIGVRSSRTSACFLNFSRRSVFLDLIPLLTRPIYFSRSSGPFSLLMTYPFFYPRSGTWGPVQCRCRCRCFLFCPLPQALQRTSASPWPPCLLF